MNKISGFITQHQSPLTLGLGLGTMIVGSGLLVKGAIDAKEELDRAVLIENRDLSFKDKLVIVVPHVTTGIACMSAGAGITYKSWKNERDNAIKYAGTAVVLEEALSKTTEAMKNTLTEKQIEAVNVEKAKLEEKEAKPIAPMVLNSYLSGGGTLVYVPQINSYILHDKIKIDELILDYNNRLLDEMFIPYKEFLIDFIQTSKDPCKEMHLRGLYNSPQYDKIGWRIDKLTNRKIKLANAGLYQGTIDCPGLPDGSPCLHLNWADEPIYPEVNISELGYY